MTMQDKVTPNRAYRDTLFRFLFNDRKRLLSLYNALNGSDYDDPEALEIFTMEDYIYMGMKNDVSFLVDSSLNLFEHQSTYNPNMPLRGFLYTAAAFRKYIARNHLDIYSSKLQDIPVPRHYVFYNGQKEMNNTDEIVLRLTDGMTGADAAANSCTEFVTRMININMGRSQELLRRCPLLQAYTVFIAEVGDHVKKGKNLEEAINQAVDHCIQGDSEFADILRMHRAEVTDMLLMEYDEAFHISKEKEISFEDGYESGVEHEKINTEHERQRAESEKQRAESEKQRAESEKQRADAAEQKLELFRLRLQGKSDAEIADCLHWTVDAVKKCFEELQ